MERLRQTIKQYSRWQELEQYCLRIEGYIKSDFSIAVENAKALLESVCKTILREKQIEHASSDSFQKLMNKTINAFDISHSEQLKQISSSLINISKNLAEVRNKVAKVSHGQHIDALSDETLDCISTEFIIGTTESITCFLIDFYEQVFPRKKSELTLRIEDNLEFNNYLDEELFEPVQIVRQGGDIAYEYAASEVLFSVEQRAYLTELFAYQQMNTEGNE